MSPYTKYLAFISPIFLLPIFLSLASCTDNDADIPTKDRISLLSDQSDKLPISHQTIQLPDAILNTDWTQASGLPFKDIGNLQAISNFSKVTKVYIGETKDDDDDTANFSEPSANIIKETAKSGCCDTQDDKNYTKTKHKCQAM